MEACRIYFIAFILALPCGIGIGLSLRAMQVKSLRNRLERQLYLNCGTKTWWSERR